MVTRVGNETNFLDGIKHLVQLDYDAIEAYDAAIERLRDENYREKIKSFRGDHERHVKTFTEYLKDMDYEYPQGPSLKSILTQGKVMIANLSGDKAILLAMRSNEFDTNIAYERLCQHHGATEDIHKKLQDGYEDEQRHLDWIEKTIQTQVLK